MRDPDVQPVTAARWSDLVELFERPGPKGGRQDTGNCWCSVWRWPMRGPEDNKARLCELVQGGDEPGLIAYVDGEPVGWVSVAPREQYASLLRSNQFRPQDDDEDVHVITCFHVDRRARGHGLARTLLAAAVDRALERGASAVEAYPADPPDYKGDPAWFLDHGFVPLRQIGKRTHLRFTPS